VQKRRIFKQNGSPRITDLQLRVVTRDCQELTNPGLLCATLVCSVPLWWNKVLRKTSPQRHRDLRGNTEKDQIRTPLIYQEGDVTGSLFY